MAAVFIQNLCGLVLFSVLLFSRSFFVLSFAALVIPSLLRIVFRLGVLTLFAVAAGVRLVLAVAGA